MVAALLAVQVTYKLTTPITAGTSNPVVLSNVLVSCVHTVVFCCGKRTPKTPI